MKKLLLVLLFVPLVSCSQEFDLEKYAKILDSELRGKDIGDGIIVKKIFSANNTLFYTYLIPNDISQFVTKSDLIKSYENLGLTKDYKKMGFDIEYIWFNRSGMAIKRIFILNSEL